MRSALVKRDRWRGREPDLLDRPVIGRPYDLAIASNSVRTRRRHYTIGTQQKKNRIAEIAFSTFNNSVGNRPPPHKFAQRLIIVYRISIRGICRNVSIWNLSTRYSRRHHRATSKHRPAVRVARTGVKHEATRRIRFCPTCFNAYLENWVILLQRRLVRSRYRIYCGIVPHSVRIRLLLKVFKMPCQ